MKLNRVLLLVCVLVGSCRMQVREVCCEIALLRVGLKCASARMQKVFNHQLVTHNARWIRVVANKLFTYRCDSDAVVFDVNLRWPPVGSVPSRVAGVCSFVGCQVAAMNC